MKKTNLKCASIKVLNVFVYCLVERCFLYATTFMYTYTYKYIPYHNTEDKYNLVNNTYKC